MTKITWLYKSWLNKKLTQELCLISNYSQPYLLIKSSNFPRGFISFDINDPNLSYQTQSQHVALDERACHLPFVTASKSTPTVLTPSLSLIFKFSKCCDLKIPFLSFSVIIHTFNGRIFSKNPQFLSIFSPSGLYSSLPNSENPLHFLKTKP